VIGASRRRSDRYCEGNARDGGPEAHRRVVVLPSTQINGPFGLSGGRGSPDLIQRATLLSQVFGGGRCVGRPRDRKLTPVERLWAPWRLEYVQAADEATGCVFCDALARDEDEALVVQRAEHAFVLLNKFPYASGHLMVAPKRHAGDFGSLDDAEAVEIHRLAAAALRALRETYEPDGFNLGWNLGRVAGAGVVDHVHLHVVPRWSGDTNFMPVLADVKVIPEHLSETRKRLAAAWR
jgi:ATP adenylyltransferase